MLHEIHENGYHKTSKTRTSVTLLHLLIKHTITVISTALIV